MTASILLKLLPVIFGLHCLEEWFGRFPEWAMKRFGPITTRNFYMLSHIPLLGIIMAISYLGETWPDSGIAQFISIAAVTALLLNGIFHLATSALFREYSPGVGTSIVFIFPYAAIFYHLQMQTLTLSWAMAIWAALFGFIASTLVIFSLTWKIPVKQ